MSIKSEMSRVTKGGGALLIAGVLLYLFIVSRSWEHPAVEREIAAPNNSSQIRCFDKLLDYRIAQRGNYWVLYNYVPAARTFACHESVTYTTHADITFLDNVLPLVERWRAPVSVALYAPGTDFDTALSSIHYLRSCGSPLITEYVSFHVYFDDRRLPQFVPQPPDALNFTVNCTMPAPWLNVNESYRSRAHLRYPINVGRNVARDAAQTHYILASDIELYPSRSVVDDFLAMVRERKYEGLKVFPLVPFEVKPDAQIPSTKRELVSMLKNGTAIPFHKYVCPQCHRIPKMNEWMKVESRTGLNVFDVVPRRGIWEPFFIGTNAEPYYEEKLSWEGARNKMTLSYALCAMDYEFHILDNAFLVHRPGIKKGRIVDRAVRRARYDTNLVMKQRVFPVLKLLYGTRKECILG